VYRAEGAQLALLLKNYRLSDDIAFRFSNRGWSDFPLTADKFARWVHAQSGNADTVNLFMDYETFGEHQWSETGIFDFLDHLPGAVLNHPDWDFRTPSEVIATYPALAPLPFPRTVSWADIERDLTAWCGNDMQTRAIAFVYSLGARIKRRNNPALLSLWRKLTSSDHFYYMCTKWFDDGDVHAYFSPYESPYEAFINYMNALTDLDESVLASAQPAPNLPPPRRASAAPA
jgi:alpha-amylase